MKIARIKDGKDLREIEIVSWEPINYSNYPQLEWLEKEDIINLPITLQDLLIEEYQIVKVKTSDGKETFAQAVRGQFDDNEGRDRTDQFEYVSCLERALTNEEVIGQIAREKGEVMWGFGLKLGYLEVYVPWCNG